MIDGMVKKLIIVTGEKETVYGELLSSLITLKDDDAESSTIVGVKDGSVEAVVWSEDVYNDNKAQLGSNTKLIFLGKNRSSKNIIPNIRFNKEMERYGIALGSIGNKTAIFISSKALKNNEELYVEFCKEYLEITKKFDNTVADTDALDEIMEKYYIHDKEYYEKTLKECAKQINEDKTDTAKKDDTNDVNTKHCVAESLSTTQQILLHGGLVGWVLSDIYGVVTYKKDLRRIIPDQMYRYAILSFYLDGLADFMEN